MKTIFASLGLLLLMVSFGVARQQQNGSGSCGFDVEGKPAQPTITGPDDIVPFVYIVEQPDSPIEIVSVDVEKMGLAISNDQHSEQGCATYKVRNRSDRIIQRFDVELFVQGVGSGGASGRRAQGSSLASGQTVEIKSCGGGYGGAPGNHVVLLVSVYLVDFGDCLYRPSQRIPRSLGVHPPW